MDLSSDNTTKTDSYFYRLMSWGRFSDQWIGLFEIDSKSTHETPEKQNVDTLIAQIESSFKEKTLTTAGKKKLQHYLHSLLNNKSADNNSDLSDVDKDKDL